MEVIILKDVLLINYSDSDVKFLKQKSKIFRVTFSFKISH